MLIGELSRRTGVRPHQLRYYEAQGLLEPVRGANGYREYDEATVTTVAQVRRLLDSGLSTDEIRELLPCVRGTEPELANCPELLDALRRRLAVLDDQADQLDRTRGLLRGYIATTARRAPWTGSSGHATAAAAVLTG